MGEQALAGKGENDVSVTRQESVQWWLAQGGKRGVEGLLLVRLCLCPTIMASVEEVLETPAKKIVCGMRLLARSTTCPRLCTYGFLGQLSPQTKKSRMGKNPNGWLRGRTAICEISNFGPAAGATVGRDSGGLI